jgi:hypothetical protein
VTLAVPFRPVERFAPVSAETLKFAPGNAVMFEFAPGKAMMVEFVLEIAETRG